MLVENIGSFDVPECRIVWLALAEVSTPDNHVDAATMYMPDGLAAGDSATSSFVATMIDYSPGMTIYARLVIGNWDLDDHADYAVVVPEY
jgi:hypothetical protein